MFTPAQPGQPLALLGEPGAMAPVEPVESLRLMRVPPPQLAARYEPAGPQVERAALARDRARPEPGYQHTETVNGRLMHALGQIVMAAGAIVRYTLHS